MDMDEAPFSYVLFVEGGEAGVANSKDRGPIWCLVTKQPDFVTEQMPDSTREAEQLAEEAEAARWHPVMAYMEYGSTW
jgi:hypothetical protein